MSNKMKERLNNQWGQGMLEYLLIVVFVVILSIGVWKTFGQKIQSVVTGTTDKISTDFSPVLEKKP